MNISNDSTWYFECFLTFSLLTSLGNTEFYDINDDLLDSHTLKNDLKTIAINTGMNSALGITAIKVASIFAKSSFQQVNKPELYLAIVGGAFIGATASLGCFRLIHNSARCFYDEVQSN